MMLMLLLALQAGNDPGVLRVQEQVPMAGDTTFTVTARLWAGFEGMTRIRSLEEEAIPKGGGGHGTLFRYEDVGVDGATWFPELETRLAFGPHDLWARGSQARRSEDITLSQYLEYDGDLHFPGEEMDVHTRMSNLEGGYSYALTSDDVELRLGGEFFFSKWRTILRPKAGGETSDEVISNLLVPVPTLEARWRFSKGMRWDSQLAFAYSFDRRRGFSLSHNFEGMLLLRTELNVDTGPLNLIVGASYLALDNVSLEHRDEADQLNYRRLGTTLGLALRF